MKTLIRGGRLLDPSQNLDEVGDLWLEDGRIAGRENAGSTVASDVDVVDARGLVVTPGLIDGRVQFGEPGLEQRETVESGLRAAAAGGFTTVLAFPACQPVNDQRAVTELIMRLAAHSSCARLHPVVAVSKGLAGEELTEMGELRQAGAVAVSDGHRSIKNAALLRRALTYARHFDLPLIHRPADKELEAEGVMNESEWSTRLGLPGVPALAEEVTLARDLLLAHESGGRYHAAALSTGGAIAQVRAAKNDGLAMTCDVTLHHLVLSDRDVALSRFNPAFKLRPPLRVVEDLAALRTALADGTIDLLVSDHTPHHPDEKDLQFSVAPFGAVGLETLLPVALDRLVRPGVITLSRLIELLTSAPARLFGLAGGTLMPGSPADLTLIDLEREHEITPSRFHSTGRSTPVAGWKCRGSAVGTFVGGRRVVLE